MKISVGVFFGGKTVEHEVAIISALQAIRNFNKEKYDIVPVYMSREGKFYTGSALMDIDNYSDMNTLTSNIREVVLVASPNNCVDLFQYPFKWRKKPLATIELAFPVVHGTNVEDGTLQGYLKTLGVPLAGPGVTASAIGMDKYASKALFRDAGLPVVHGLRFTANEFVKNPDKVIAMLEWKLPYPMIVKPLDLGSSVGVGLAKDKRELHDAIENAAEYSSLLLAEAAVTKLREINCSVLGDRDGAEASECEEPLGSAQILSYEDKYAGGDGGSKGMSSLKRLLPAPI
ncbi:MAG: D-alanine--D-alanine ligase, partial [Oscillospiraceae bacterium]|nr:D-alanine--D-alanine ligase [Oscillospiraceae bacterium]